MRKEACSCEIACTLAGSLHTRESEIYSELSISEVKSDKGVESQGDQMSMELFSCMEGSKDMSV